MPKVDLHMVEEVSRTGYPPPFDREVAGRWARKLAPATGLTELGANIVRLQPGAWSSQRHWHDGEDEILIMLTGNAMLVEDGGETPLAPGDVAAFPKGTGNGHHLINRSDRDCSFFVVGAGPCTGGGYSDIDMLFTPDGSYVRKDGTPY
ncbi:MAG: cupin domain-containing protein [Sphingomicrobium sp.]